MMKFKVTIWRRGRNKNERGKPPRLQLQLLDTFPFPHSPSEIVLIL